MYLGLDKPTLDTNTCYRDDNGDNNLLLPIMEVIWYVKESNTGLMTLSTQVATAKLPKNL